MQAKTIYLMEVFGRSRQLENNEDNKHRKFSLAVLITAKKKDRDVCS